MSPLTSGLVAGLLFGGITVLTMMPMEHPDKQRAMLAAFASRFGIGLAIAVIVLPYPGWVTGLFFGFLLSFAGAVQARRYVPILGLGAIGGAIIGGIIHGWTI